MLTDGLVLGAILSGAVTSGGIVLLVLAMRGMEAKPSKKQARPDLAKTLSTRGAIAIITGFVVLAVTMWPVAAVGSGLLVFFWNSIAGGAREERTSMARLEALAAWTESLRDTIAGAVGLEQAIPASLRAVPPVLAPDLRMLVDRLHTRMPLAEALRRFGDDLNDPSADLVIAALILNAKLRGPGLRDMLGSLAKSARSELDVRRKIEADRRSTRRSVLVVVGVSVGTAVLLVVTNPSYVAEYDDTLGQLVLCVVFGLFALGFFWMRRLAKFQMPGRFLASADSDASEANPALAGREAT